MSSPFLSLSSAGTADSDPLPGTQARGLPFRTAKQLKEGLLREPGPHSLQAGGFVPLPSLVQLPPASAQPTYNYSNQDKGGHKVRTSDTYSKHLD